jgi:hypothetical protein
VLHHFVLVRILIHIKTSSFIENSIFSVVNRNSHNKKFSDNGRRIPDFELETLRDLHSGEHFLSNRNILYNPFNGAAFLNTEIKHLPHIHISQIFITDRCLGKGAFGEVWCGVVKNDDGTEERVAIKVKKLFEAFQSQVFNVVCCDNYLDAS